MCYLLIASALLIILLIFGLNQNYTIITILSLVVAFSNVVATIIVNYVSKSNHSKNHSYCLAERDQLKFLIPVITGTGVLSALTSMTLAEKTITAESATRTITYNMPNTTLDKLEVIVFCVALLLSSVVVGRYYRELCERIYKDEETRENAKEKILQDLEQNLKILCSQKAAFQKANSQIISTPPTLTTKGGKRYTLCVEELLPK